MADTLPCSNSLTSAVGARFREVSSNERFQEALKKYKGEVEEWFSHVREFVASWNEEVNGGNWSAEEKEILVFPDIQPPLDFESESRFIYQLNVTSQDRQHLAINLYLSLGNVLFRVREHIDRSHKVCRYLLRRKPPSSVFEEQIPDIKESLSLTATVAAIEDPLEALQFLREVAGNSEQQKFVFTAGEFNSLIDDLILQGDDGVDDFDE